MGDLLDLLERLFQGPIPQILLWAMLALFLLALLLRSISYLQKEIIPIFYSAEQARRRNRRQRFAEHIEHELRRFNSMEEWSDYRFTELEAEVEAEGRRRHPLIPFLTKRDPLRREKSLTKALESSTERLIHLEGVPGSGKSVALRHVALTMAHQAMQSRNAKTIIPLYINLKSLKRNVKPGYESSVDAQFINGFVLESLNRANDRNVATFLEDEFQAGLNDGLWLFLFDSFDEIPEVLSSTEADSVINLYAQAIDDFLHGMNKCRGIIASREYRGPRYLNWSKFRIMPLSVRHQEELIKRAELSSDDEARAIGGLLTGSQGNRQFVENPMFLGLLCEFVRTNHRYPEHDFKVYEAFVSSRLARDESRLLHRFGLQASELQRCAENIAFCMQKDSSLGLISNLQEITLALSRHDLDSEVDINLVLDALQFIKLAKVEDDLGTRGQETFTFSHRRLQEYLATMVLIREPDRVPMIELLTNGIWRESAVVLLQQAQSPKELEPILNTAIDQIEWLLSKVPINEEKQADKSSASLHSSNMLPRNFPWPSGLLHILELLQAGLIGRTQLVPDTLRLLYCIVVSVAWSSKKWLLSDMQAVLSVSGLLPQSVLRALLTEGLTHPSQSLRDTAYQQATSLDVLTPLHISAIRIWLVEITRKGRLYREEKVIKAYLLRLDQSEHLLDVVRFLKAIPYFSLVMGILVTSIISFRFVEHYSLPFLLLISFTLLLPILIRAFIWGPYRNYLMLISIVGATATFLSLLFQLYVYSFETLAFFYGSFFGYFYAFEWQDYAYRLATKGNLTKIYQWPLALVSPLVIVPLYVVRKGLGLTIVWLRDRLGDIGRQLRSVYGLLGVLGKILFFLVFGGAFVWLFSSQRVPAAIQVAIVIFVPAASLMLLIITSMLPTMRSYFRARRHFKVASKSSEKISMDQYLQTIRDYMTEEYYIRYTRLIRERNLLRYSSDDLELLRRLASQLQHDLLVCQEDKSLWDYPKEIKTGVDKEDTFVHWYRGFLLCQANKINHPLGLVPVSLAERTYGISILGWETLDELNLLLKQAQDYQNDRPTM